MTFAQTVLDQLGTADAAAVRLAGATRCNRIVRVPKACSVVGLSRHKSW